MPGRSRSDTRPTWSQHARTPERRVVLPSARRCRHLAGSGAVHRRSFCSAAAAGPARMRSSPTAVVVGQRLGTRSETMASTWPPRRRRAARARPERPTGHTSCAQPAAAAMSHRGGETTRAASDGDPCTTVNSVTTPVNTTIHATPM